MAANSALNITNSYSHTGISGSAGTVTDSFADGPNYPFASGTAANQIDTVWSASATLTSTSTTFTLSALSGIGGSSVAFARVRKLWIHNTATVDGNVLLVAPGATHPWNTAIVSTGGVEVPAGGCLLLVAPNTTGFTVTASSADQITLTATGTVPYVISVEGASV